MVGLISNVSNVSHISDPSLINQALNLEVFGSPIGKSLAKLTSSTLIINFCTVVQTYFTSLCFASLDTFTIEFVSLRFLCGKLCNYFLSKKYMFL